MIEVPTLSWEAEAGVFPGSNQPGLQSKFQDMLQSYTEKPCLRKQNKKHRELIEKSKAELKNAFCIVFICLNPINV